MGSVGGDSLYDTSKIRGVREERGVVEGVVKANVHKANMGVISVWVPRYSSDQNDSDEWRQVRYCTPYYSRTSVVDPTNNYLSTKQTAGIVTPPPDIGTTVLCVFPEGRTADGYYFACVPDLYMMQNLPETTVDIHKGGGIPVASAEFNDSPEGKNQTSNNTFTNWKRPDDARPEDEISQEILKKQGLDKDFVRGLSTSGYMRESPSELMGFSTKGRRIDVDGEDLLIKYASEITSGTDDKDIQDKLLGPKYRRKGHSLTLDDGDFKGNSNQVRLRTSTGHQILMNDSEGVIYISNADGNTWIELGKNGTLDVYAEDSINFRTKNINFHADENIKMHSKGFTQLVSEKQVHVQAKEDMNLFTEREIGVTAMSGVNVLSNSAMKFTSSGPGYFNAGSFASIKGSLVLLQGPSSPAKTVKPVQQAQRLDVSQEADENDGYLPNTSVVTSVDRTISHEPYLAHGLKNSPSAYSGGLQGGGGGLGGFIQIVSAAIAVAGALPPGPADGLSPGALGGKLDTSGFVGDGAGGIVMSGGKPVLAGVQDVAGNVSTSSFDLGSLGEKFSDFGGDLFSELPSGDGFFSGVSDWWADSGLSEFGSGVYDTVSSFGSEVAEIGGQFIGDVKGFTEEFQQITNEVKGNFNSLGAELDAVVPGSSAYLTELLPINKIDVLDQVLNTPLVASISVNDIAAMSDTGFEVGALDAEQILAVGATVTKAVGADGLYTYIDAGTQAVGKYGHTAKQLYDAGYVSGETIFNDQMASPTAWTGKQNINGITDYLANPHVQELVQQGNLVQDYQSLVNLGGITPEDRPENVMAMLASSMTSNPDIAATVRRGEIPEGVVRNTTNIPFGVDPVGWVKEQMGKGAVSNAVVKGSGEVPLKFQPTITDSPSLPDTRFS